MIKKQTLNQPNAQKTYRKKQANKGLTRYELQIPASAKATFEAMAAAIAEEYVHPYAQRQRFAKARAQLFDDLTKGIKHEFFQLKDEIRDLKAEIKALSPTFFQNKDNSALPLPEAINQLDDDPDQLKQYLARIYQERQTLQRDSQHYQHHMEQYKKLYEVASDFNQQLKAKLQQEGVDIEEDARFEDEI